jgi:hypothetical protein
MSRSKAGNFSSSMMVVDDGRTKAWAHGRSVFGLTAGFASVVAAHLLHSREDIPPGVHAMSPGVISSEAARSALASAGIHIEVL